MSKKTKNKARVKAKANHKEVTPAPRDGPTFNFRARNRDVIKRAKAAAGKAGLSLNSWMNEVVEQAAAAQ